MIASTFTGVVRPLQILILCLGAILFLWMARAMVVETRPDGDPLLRRPARSTWLELEILEPAEYDGQRLEVETSLVVGRSSEADQQLRDTFISGRHARFTRDENELLLEDLGSTNGTYVNQELVKGRVQLQRGDIIQIGGILIEVVK